ncbi:MAG TPA: PAS domain S-box protein, partial [Actinomycetota bacterium]|nr:PAS domain S-box protein [Actinomycetota bacterium]
GALDGALQRLGEAAEVGRVAFLEPPRQSGSGWVWPIAREWAAPGLPLLEDLDVAPFSADRERLAPLIEEMTQGRALIVRPADLPEEEAGFLQAAGIRSFAAVPVSTRGTWLGFLALGDGDRSWSEAELDALRAAANTIGAAISRQRAEEKLRETNEALRALVQAVPVAIASFDLDGKIRMWTPAAEDMFGWTQGEVIGRRPPYVTEENAADFDGLMTQLREGRSVRNAEVTRKRKDGTPIVLSVSAGPMRDAKGDINGSISTALDITEQKEAQEELHRIIALLRKSDRERRRLLARLVEAQEEERRRISEDIHDDSIQVMTVAGLRIEALRRRIADPEAVALLAKVEESVRTSMDRLRHLMFDLRPPALDREGLGMALRAMVERMERDWGLRFEVEDRLDQDPPQEARIIIYRIVQEALVNVRKHAQAKSVQLRMEPQQHGIFVRIRDDGRGFRPDDGQGAGVPSTDLLEGEDGETGIGDANGIMHLGLRAMRERAEMAGGWWRIDSAPGEGSVIEFWVPEQVQSSTYSR